MKKMFGSVCFLLRRVLGMSSKVSKRVDLRGDFDTKTMRYLKNQRDKAAMSDADLRGDFDTKTMRYWENQRDKAGMSDEDDDLIEAYSSLLEGNKGPIGRLSDLPASKETIRNVLTKAKEDLVFRLGLDALEMGLLVLDRFVPDEEYESAQKDMHKAMELLEQKDEEGFFELCKNVPPATNKAINAFMRIILLSKKKQG